MEMKERPITWTDPVLWLSIFFHHPIAMSIITVSSSREYCVYPFTANMKPPLTFNWEGPRVAMCVCVYVGSSGRSLKGNVEVWMVALDTEERWNVRNTSEAIGIAENWAAGATRNEQAYYIVHTAVGCVLLLLTGRHFDVVSGDEWVWNNWHRS